MLLLNFNFAMIYIIHKLLGLIKNLMNDRRDNIFECFFKKYDRLIFFTKIFFFIIYDEKGTKYDMPVLNHLKYQ